MDNHSGKIILNRISQHKIRCCKWLLCLIGGVLICTSPGCAAIEVVKNSDQRMISEDQKNFVNIDNNMNAYRDDNMSNKPVDARVFLEPELYVSDIQDEEIEETNVNQDFANTVAGIVPHHTVAHKIIRNFYSNVSRRNAYDLIIVISPNHSSKGPRFQVTTKDFLTYDGVVTSEKDIARELIAEEFVTEATDEVIKNEHGQLVQMNYIAHYFDSIPVLSLLINETRDYEGIEALRDKIVNLVNEKNVLIIASVDFSHYLPLDEANKMDAVTRSILMANESRQLISKSNDYIDSPSSYAVLIEWLSARETTFTTKIIEHSNSALILQNKNLIETTSYFSVVYTRG